MRDTGYGLSRARKKSKTNTKKNMAWGRTLYRISGRFLQNILAVAEGIYRCWRQSKRNNRACRTVFVHLSLLWHNKQCGAVQCTIDYGVRRLLAAVLRMRDVPPDKAQQFLVSILCNQTCVVSQFSKYCSLEATIRRTIKFDRAAAPKLCSTTQPSFRQKETP